jgi:hypothetical protein
LLDRAIADPDPWRGVVGFLERSLELQAEDRGLHQLIIGAAGAFERIARTRERLQPDFERLIERARDGGQLRPDLELQDIAMLHLMLGSVIDVTHELQPELWRRYLAIVVEGLRADPEPPRPFAVPPLPLDQQDAAMAVAKGARRR